MYNNIKLEKSLYSISGKNFTQALTELDPDSAYIGTELAGLDAYERQLKRFNIRTSGADCDTVDKFFKTSQTAVLFPEFVRRAIVAGMNSTVLKEIIAVNSECDGYDFRGYSIVTGSAPYTTPLAAGSSFPETAIKQGESIELIKYGRMITAPYEVICNQKLELFACTLKSIGRMIANAIVTNCMTTLITDTTQISSSVSGEYSYADLVSLASKISDYNVTTLLASPSIFGKISALPELAECKAADVNCIQLPFGPKIYRVSGYTGTGIVAIDRNYALQLITNTTGVVIEYEKLISKLTNNIIVSVYFNSQKVIPAASVMLVYKAA